MNKKRISILLLLILILAGIFLWLDFSKKDDIKVVPVTMITPSLVQQYFGHYFNLSFNYSIDKIKVEENETTISLKDKDSGDLLLSISGNDMCDASVYANLEKVTFSGNTFWKFSKPFSSVPGYAVIHPKTGVCLVISMPGSIPEKNYTANDIKLLDEVVTSMTFTEKSKEISARFTCDGNKIIDAVFNKGENNSVDLLLSDGRNLSLPQTISASGARYANIDESFVFWNKGDDAFVIENSTTTFSGCSTKVRENNTSLANPASTNCEKQGGTLEIQTKEDGSQYGLCYFDDARACEEWAMLRGDCPVGGVKTTGYETVAQKYCAWLGGRTLSVSDAVCTFNDNSTCLDADLYLDACEKGGWPKK
jgi:putative hemolysin